jgi:hypothetical protein
VLSERISKLSSLISARGWLGRETVEPDRENDGRASRLPPAASRDVRPGIGLVPIKALAIRVWPFCAAWSACLWRVFGSGWLHVQRWRSIQAAYVQLLCIDKYRVLLLLRFLRGLLCQF